MSKQNNTATKTLLEAEEMANALKESTKKSLSEMVKAAISQMILESEDEDEKETDTPEPAETDTETSAPETQEDNDDYDEEDVETDDDSTDADSEESSEDTEDEDWSDMEDYKVGDNEYDLSSLDNEEALKVYNKLDDDDDILVKKVDDTSYEIKDEETGAEYVIDIDVDALTDANNDVEDIDVDGEDEVELDLSDEDEEPEGEFDVEIEDEPEDETDVEIDDEPEDELDIDVVDDDDEDVLNETELGYTNTYQKDVMPGLNMNEPANSNVTYSMDAGAPKGNKRPYSGYKKETGKPFVQENVEECGLMTDEPELEEATNVGGAVQQRTSSKSNIPSGRKNYGPKTKRHVSAAGEYSETINEELKAIKEDNTKYRNYIGTIKKNLYEAFVTNVKLGNILKLVCENSTTPEEKQNIVKRFNEAKTIKESKMLYETIKNELKATAKSAPMLEHQLSVEPKKTLNETTIFTSNPVLDLMHRMDNMDKMWKK